MILAIFLPTRKECDYLDFNNAEKDVRKQNTLKVREKEEAGKIWNRHPSFLAVSYLGS